MATYPLGTDQFTVEVRLSGQYGATTAGFPQGFAPCDGIVVGAYATARVSAGTNPTLTLQVQQGTTDLFSTPVSITAGSNATASLATTPTFSAGAAFTADIAIGGTNTPLWDDIAATLICQRIVT